MGSISTNGLCVLTGLEAIDINLGNSNWPGYEYRIVSSNKEATLYLPEHAEKWKERPQIKQIQHIIAGLFLNNNWPADVFNRILNPSDLLKIVESRIYPKTPQEKREFLCLNLYKLLRFDGQIIKRNLSSLESHKFYFTNSTEELFYLKSLMADELIVVENQISTAKIEFTYKGLNYALELEESGHVSNNCFVAMSFSGSCVEIREAIKQACKETGFNPILVDEIDPGMTNTINDAIVANLKKCKFCIADFTEQKDGVYFESGFALGQGKRVIYTCKEDWFNKSHFDINHFPHIIYPNVAELKRQLVDRINAWITQ